MTIKLPRRVKHEEGTFVILTAESSFFSKVTDFDHEVDQVLNREHIVVQDWVLRVDGLYERPELVDEFSVVRVDPEVRREHQVQEEVFAHPGITDQESKLSKQLD